MTLDLSDDEARLVYADELQRAGDPLGELIAIQHHLLKQPDDASARKVEAALFKKHPSLRPVGHAQLEIEWRLGFIERASVRRDSDPDDGPLRALMTHRSSAQLVELALGSYSTGGAERFTARIDALVAGEPRTSLRRLFIGDFKPDEKRGYYHSHEYPSYDFGGPLAPLWPLYPRLEELYLAQSLDGFGAIDLPELRTFEFHVYPFRLPELESITNARWPKLERFVIGAGRREAEYSLENFLAMMLALTEAPLRDLVLMDLDYADELLEFCGGRLGRLETLDLRNGTFTDRGAKMLADLQLPKLNVLDLGSTDVTREGVDMLRAAYPDCDLSHPR